jgi:hypothetical protein
MKYVNLHLTIEVPDDFDWDDDTPVAKWIRDVEELKGLCKNDALGCSLQHHASGNVITEEEWDALED